jgi:nicotinate-nucleotide adenylyltransferase
MKTLCLGGSFNPIHHGHLICARAAAEARGFGRVLLIPSGQPPHKPDDPQLASPEHRLRMCQLAASATASFDVCDLELFRSGPSFTIDTAQELRRQGFDAVHWLIGADMLNFLPKWHRPLELLKQVEFIVMARPGVTIDWSQLPREYQHLESNVVAVPQIDISATDLRRRIRANLSIDFLTPRRVIDYIRAENLYRG